MQKKSEQAVTHCVLRVSQWEPFVRQPKGHHGRGSLSQEALSSPRGSRSCGETTKSTELPQKEVRDRTALRPKKKGKKAQNHIASGTGGTCAMRCQSVLAACELSLLLLLRVRDGSALYGLCARLLQAVCPLELYIQQPSDLFI